MPEFKPEKPTPPLQTPHAFPEIKTRLTQPEVKVEPMQAKKETPEEILGIKPRVQDTTRKPEPVSRENPLPARPEGPLSKTSGGMLTPDEIAELAGKIPSREPLEEPKLERALSFEPATERRSKPIKPLSQEAEIEKLLEEREKTKNARPGLLRILGVFLLLISLSGGAYFGYFKFFKKEAEEPIPPDKPKPPIEVIIPQPLKPLLRVDSTITLKIRQLTHEEILPQLETLKNSVSPEKSVAYVTILLHNDEVARFISLSEFFGLMKIQAPTTLKSYNNYSLYLYQQTKNDEELCLANGITDKACHGPRLGLVIDLASKEGASIEEEKGEALKALVSWETTSMVQDFSAFILSPTPAIRPPSFLSGRYNDMPTRYINLPIHTISVDWTIKDQYLIIATSMDAARTAIDRLETKKN